MAHICLYINMFSLDTCTIYVVYRLALNKMSLISSIIFEVIFFSTILLLMSLQPFQKKIYALGVHMFETP